MLKEDDRVGIADGGFQQALGVGGVIGRDDLEARHIGIPGGIIVGVLRADTAGGAIGTAEDDRTTHLATGHVERLGGGIDDVVDGLHGEVEGHEFNDRTQPVEGRADTQAGKAVLGDRRVDDALGTELVQQATGDLVGALVFGDFFTHHEDGVIAAHLLGHRIAQGVADRGGDHAGTGRNIRISRCGDNRRRNGSGFRFRVRCRDRRSFRRCSGFGRVH